MSEYEQKLDEIRAANRHLLDAHPHIARHAPATDDPVQVMQFIDTQLTIRQIAISKGHLK